MQFGLCGSPNIDLCVHAAVAIPWCCLLSSNRLSCRGHHSHHGLTHLCVDPFKWFLRCFLHGFHLERRGLNFTSCSVAPSTKDELYQASEDFDGKRNQWFSSILSWWSQENRDKWSSVEICSKKLVMMHEEREIWSEILLSLLKWERKCVDNSSSVFM